MKCNLLRSGLKLSNFKGRNKTHFRITFRFDKTGNLKITYPISK